VIEAEKATTTGRLARMADLLGVSRSGYYAWVARQGAQPGPAASRRADLVLKIKVAHDASDGVNGAPRILADLREGGEVVSGKTVAKQMRPMGSAGSVHARGHRSPRSATTPCTRSRTWCRGASTRAG
jgi:putative transposase